MDLFTYLMAKNGNNSSVHGDLFSYLLGKGQSQTQTISGVTIYIPDAKKLVSFMMTKESTQDGEPTPDNPVPVNVVEGYRNLFDKDNATIQIGYIKSDGDLSSEGNSTVTSSYTEITPNLNYTVNGFLLETIAFYDNSYNFIKRVININATHYTFNENASYIRIQGKTVNFNINTLQLTKGNQELPYVPYGNNYIAVNVSDGTNANSVPLPLNGNEIVGIGDYLDEYIVDKNGHCWLNKLTGKVILDGINQKLIAKHPTLKTDTKGFYNFGLPNKILGFPSGSTNLGMSDNFRFVSGSASTAFNSNSSGIWWEGSSVLCYMILEQTSVANANNWLSTHNTTIHYVLAIPELIDLNTTVDLKLFKGVNNISNSEDGYMTIEYR